ncbi:MAG: hypothetical protein ACTSUR_08445 [Candidatus Heimdallarchaeaceae archaeon]
MENERKMKLNNPFTKKNITITLLLVGLTANSIFLGYYIGSDLKTESDKYVSTMILVPVEIDSIDSLFFLAIVVELFRVPDIDYRVQTCYYNDNLSIYTLNATLLRVDFIITEPYYYFRIDNWFYTYAKFDLNATYSFTLTVDFWYLTVVNVERENIL